MIAAQTDIPGPEEGVVYGQIIPFNGDDFSSGSIVWSSSEDEPESEEKQKEAEENDD